MIQIIPIIMFLAQTPAPQADTDSDAYQVELEAYVSTFLHTVRLMRSYEQRKADALGTIPLIIKFCDQYDIDPLLVAVVMTFESSWRPNVTGSRGELGVMQTMPRHFRSFDLSTPEGQIHAGVSHLRASLDACGGDLEQGLNYYGSGRCKPVLKFVRWRVNAYRRAIKRFRKEVKETAVAPETTN